MLYYRYIKKGDYMIRTIIYIAFFVAMLLCFLNPELIEVVWPLVIPFALLSTYDSKKK